MQQMQARVGTARRQTPKNLSEMSFSLLGYRKTGEKEMKTRPITFEVNENGCHICTSHAPNTGGYPTLMKSGKKWTVARYIHSQLYGDIPAGVLVCHTCDNHMCINSAHLFLGTPKDNMQDMSKKGRTVKAFGERNGNNKLTQLMIIGIVRDLKTLNCSQISRNRNIPVRTINDIKNGKRWAWLTRKISRALDMAETAPYFYKSKTGGLGFLSDKKFEPCPEGYELDPSFFAGKGVP